MRHDHIQEVPSSAYLLVEVHYTPIGRTFVDRPRVGFYYSKHATTKKGRKVPSRRLISKDISIPPYESNYTRYPEMVFDEEVDILDITPHMHFRGKSAEYYRENNMGEKELLLRVPYYQFHFQYRYKLAAPYRFSRGDSLKAKFVFDNSTENRANPDPSATVVHGAAITDEMLITFLTTKEISLE